MLPLALQLIEAELSVILVINMMDEAEMLGIEVNSHALEDALDIPVVCIVAATGNGLPELRKRVSEYVEQR